MRNTLIVLMITAAVMICAGCGSAGKAADQAKERTDTAETETAALPALAAESPQPAENMSGVMSFQAFLAAEDDSPVTVEGYVQAKEARRDGCCGLYMQNEEGAYYLSRLRCSQQEYDTLKTGRKIRVNGYKSHWNDAIEISDASFTLLEGNLIAEAEDVTALIGSDALRRHQNEKVAFSGMTVEVMPDGHSVWYRGWDNTAPAEEDSELWFRASSAGTVCDFTIKPSLCENRDEVLETLQQLQAGDRVDLTGFLRFYNGALPRITAITQSEGMLTEAS